MSERYTINFKSGTIGLGCTKMLSSMLAGVMCVLKTKTDRVPKRPWEGISINLVIGLLVMDKFDSVYTVVDCFLKEIVVFLVASFITPEKLAAEFRDKVWRCHGLPKSILSD